MLAVSNLSKRFADRLVLNQVSFVVNQGERVGLVGPNGAGKTTLLRIIAGIEPADGGSVGLPPGARVGYLRQGFADLPGGTLSDLLDGPMEGLLRVQGDLDAATANLGGGNDATLQAYDDALAAFEAAGGYAAIDELTVMLGALGLPDVAISTPLANLSGGQKTRAGLVALLASRPSLLLLDEPTNHLDIDALAWLENFLIEQRVTAIIVSHDRALLDAAVTGILELDDATRQATAYAGDYTEYRDAKRAVEEAQRQAYFRQQREVAHIERNISAVASHAMGTERGTQNDYLRRRSKKVARTAKVRERKLERLLESEERIDKPDLRWGMALDFGDAREVSRDIAVVEEAMVQLGGRTILDAVNLHIRAGERVAVTGPNGGGKSTLIRLLLGAVPPATGSVRLGPNVVPGLYSQEQETVDPIRTVLEHARAVSAMSETEARSFLHLFLFGGDAVFQRAGDLSYGERARLALALLVLQGANFLLLDEPLNHLDLPSRERFEEALTRFDGTLLIVLHDRYAIERLATRVIEVRGGTLHVR
ncbi:MAG: ribosomal protection-like ABC-F family protein [Thermomicrobiales bacterium]